MRAASLITTLLIALRIPALAGECVDYGQYVHFVTRFQSGIGGDVRAVALQGEVAYVARFTPSLGGTDFLCVDLSDPFAATLLGEIDTGAHGFDVQVAGSCAYLASPGVGVHVIDITDPMLPTVEGLLSNTDAHTVWIDGTDLYVASQAGGLVSVDASDPTDPTAADTVLFGTPAWQLTTRDGYAYVAIAEGGLAVVDISNPASMSVVATLDLGVSARSVDLGGDYAFVGGGNATNGLTVVEIKNPAAPAVVGSASGSHGLSLVIDASVAYLGGSSVNVFDVSTPALPEYVTDSDIAVYGSKGHAVALGGAFGVGDYIVTAAGTAGMEVGVPGVVDAPPRLGAYTGANSVYNCRAAGNRVVMQTFLPSDITVVDATNPASPALLGTAELPVGAATDMDIDDSGNYAVMPYFQSFDPDGFAIFDVSGAPSLVVTRTIPYKPERCDWEGDHLYITDSWNSPGRLVIYDMSNPASPTWVGATAMGVASSVGGVDVVGDYAYVAMNDEFEPSSGLAVIDVSNKAAPSVDAITTGSIAGSDVVVEGIYAYVIETSYSPPRLATVNVSDPSAPSVVKVQWLAGGAQAITAADGYLYAAVFDRGTQVFDISDPASPAVVGNLHSGDRSWDVACEGDRVYVASESDGMEIFSRQCAAASGIRPIFDTPSVARLAGAWPNPFNPQTTIAVELPGRDNVRVTVHDVAGRLVAVLAEGPFDGGRTDVSWNGRSQLGAPVSSGVYFVRLQASRSTDTIRIVLLK